MVKETHKIWGEPDIAITATCIRVPIMRAHAESINLEFERDVSEEEVRPRAIAQVTTGSSRILRSMHEAASCGMLAYAIGMLEEIAAFDVKLLMSSICLQQDELGKRLLCACARH